MEFTELAEFKKELKYLLKKYRSLNHDLALLKEFLETHPRGYEPHVFPINNLGIQTEILKVKHFRCTALKGKGSRSGIRIIYAYFATQNKVEFVEIYYKEHDDSDCDIARIKKYYV